MKQLLAILFFVCHFCGVAQNNTGSSFYGDSKADLGVCPKRSNALSETDVINLITEMLSRYGIRNRYIILNCTEVDNCQATLYNGKPYILYNPNFLNSVKKLNFKSADLPIADKDWITLTILAHELGHHVNNHLINPLPDATQWDMELEADETAGFIIYMMGGSLVQAQLAFNEIAEQGTYTHPGRQKRLDAIARGWNDARQRYERPVPSEPGNNNPNKPAPANPGNNTGTANMQDAEGNIYKTIKIGYQTWMQSNLDVSKFRDGSIIPEAKTYKDWEKAANNQQPAWCYYNDQKPDGKGYGKLYNWYAVTDPRGLAPQGWHIPSVTEWTNLTDYLGGEEVAGIKLKSKDDWLSFYDSGGGTNESGFSGLPCGIRLYDGSFKWLTEYGHWWSSTEKSKDNAWAQKLMAEMVKTYKTDYLKGAGLSVRCIKD